MASQWVCMGFAGDCIGDALETNWSRIEVALEVLWLCRASPWLCSGFALDLHWLRIGFAVALHWLKAFAMNFHWLRIGCALDLDWLCIEIVLKLYWRCHACFGFALALH